MMVDLHSYQQKLSGLYDSPLMASFNPSTDLLIEFLGASQDLLDEVKRLRLLRDGYQGEGKIPYV